MLKDLIKFVTALVFALVLGDAADAQGQVWSFNEIYSNSDGSVQFIVFGKTATNYGGPLARNVLVARGSNFSGEHTFVFGNDTPAAPASGTYTVLAGTKGFADLGIVKPDVVIPNGFISTYTGSISIASLGTCTASYASLPTDGAMALYPGGCEGSADADIPSVSAARATNFAGQCYSFANYPVTPVTPAVVEYQNTRDFPGNPGGHFFYTDDTAEQARVDCGSAGWYERTGRTFKSGGSKQLCRFYGSTVPGPNAHFYTISDQECDQLKALQTVPAPSDVQQWNYEGLRFAEVPPLLGATGASCAVGTLPVFRAYNNAYPAAGPKNPWDSAHRYSANQADIQQLVTQFGWRDEGIAFCSPQ